MNEAQLQVVAPDWSATPGVRVASTLRTGGVSRGSFGTLNLAAHVGDDPTLVRENRRRLADALALPAEPLWLEQVHGIDVVVNDGSVLTARADAAVAFAPGRVCVVMTADCLPVVFADRAATCFGVAHAGWRGLAGGVLEQTVAALDRDPGELQAWLGPAIGQPAFEVGVEVREAFVARAPEFAAGFVVNARGRYQADLYLLARLVLGRCGLAEITGGGWCTASEPERYFSFRRDGETGRMATLAWLV